jgi:serine phosphatase RsbU (regulator of sigma subunit)
MLSPLLLKDAVNVELAPGDILAVMTDGVYECVDPDEEEFGQEGVARLLAERHADPLEDLVQTVQETVRDHRHGAPPDDDVTVVLLRRNRD